MHISALQTRLLHVCSWIDEVLQQHRHRARAITSLRFPRLPQYFESTTLSRASVVVLDHVPKPPLTALGLPQFAAFEAMDADGITYKDTYFVRRERAHDESLHFHELVHVIQWQLLGPEQFILSYALALAELGYERNPFEQAAYNLQNRFERHEATFSVEAAVRHHLGR